MVTRIGALLLLLLLFARSAPAIDSDSGTSRNIPARIDGVEIETISGWFANLYPWRYTPYDATVYPVPRLWTPMAFQSPHAVTEQNRLLDEYGSGADVLEYNVNPAYPDHNHWLSTYFRNGSRPFFLAYEHVYGTRYMPADGPKNMDLAINQQIFRADIDFILRNVVLPFRDRYVTHRGRAVIYLWSTVQMEGDFASLLDQMRAKYPVMFIGSINILGMPSDPKVVRNLQALDGFMEYALVTNDYTRMVDGYRESSARWRLAINRFERETGKKYLFIPTFQAAYDDSRLIPPRNNPPMYPKTRAEVIRHASAVKSYMGTTYDRLGPFVVFSELAEGAAVIESECRPETMDREDRYVGCGTARLEIVKQFFGR
jgi:hypothetical protein